MLEEELKLIERERLRAEGTLLDRKEEEYHLQNAKVRACIRLREARPDTFDLILKNYALMDDFGMDADPVFTLLRGLSVRKLNEIGRHVSMFLDLDNQTELARDFWSALKVVVRWETQEAIRNDELERLRQEGRLAASGRSLEVGLHAQVDEDVQQLFAGKSHAELEQLEQEIQGQLTEGLVPDPEYWDAVLKRLQVHKCRARLRQLHEQLRGEYEERKRTGTLRPMEDRRSLLPPQPLAGAEGEDAPKLARWEDEEDEGRGAAAAIPPPPLATAAAAGAAGNAEEIDLPEEEEEEAAGAEQAPGQDLAMAGGRAVHPLDGYTDEELARMSPEPEDESVAGGRPIEQPEDDWARIMELRSRLKAAATERFREAAASGSGRLEAGDTAYREMLSNPSMTSTGHPTVRLLKEPETEDQDQHGKEAAGKSEAAGPKPMGPELPRESSNSCFLASARRKD